MIRIYLSVVVAFLMITACGGSLRVTVETIDPSYIETINTRQELIVVLAAAIDPGQPTQKYLRDLMKKHLSNYEQLAKEYEKEADSIRDNEAARTLRHLASSLRVDSKDQITPMYDKKIEQLNELDFEIAKVFSAESVKRPKELDLLGSELSRLLVKRDSIVKKFKDAVYDDLADLKRTPALDPPEVKKAKEAVALQIKSTQKAARLIPIGAELVEDPLAYAVSSAPDEFWSQDFQETFGGGHFGDFNFAIKMENYASFTIKGLTFDPSEVANIASKVSAQSLLYAAQIAGVPVSLTDPGAELGGGISAIADRSEALVLMEENTMARAARLRSQKAALRLIADRIFSERENLESKNAIVRKTAKEAIDATYTAHKTRLTLDGNNQ